MPSPPREGESADLKHTIIDTRTQRNRGVGSLEIYHCYSEILPFYLGGSRGQLRGHKHDKSFAAASQSDLNMIFYDSTAVITPEIRALVSLT